jgi:hypothetical protein
MIRPNPLLTSSINEEKCFHETNFSSLTRKNKSFSHQNFVQLFFIVSQFEVHDNITHKAALESNPFVKFEFLSKLINCKYLKHEG